MRFSLKLQKLRKENNLSQELLAEKLNMSRQAISKWESGISYPDMSTMINICKVLNCNIEDLLDDDVIGNNSSSKSDKFNINKYIKEMLNFITKSYNMFWSMKFIDKIRCLIEIGFIILVIFLLYLIVWQLLDISIMQLFRSLPDPLSFFFYRIFKMFYILFTCVIGAIITIHLFKIRYLDYYVTVEDSNASNKTIEKSIEEKTNTKRQEKIIIRDPKHTTYNFFDLLARIVHSILKIFTLFILIPLIISFITLFIILTLSILWIKYGNIFIGIIICSIGGLLVNYIFIEFFCSFIFNKKSHLKRLFIMFISGLVIVGIGFGITLNELSKFDYTNKIENTTLTLKMEDNLLFNSLLDEDYKDIIIDNSIDNILINIDYEYNTIPILRKYNGVYHINLEYPDYNIKDILNDIKDKKIHNGDYYYKVNSITISESNYNKIKENINKYNEYFYGE